MANWRGTARSNHFRVKDEFAFRAWAGTLGLDVVENSGSPGLFSVFPGKTSEDGDWPSSRLREAGDDFDRDEEERVYFFAELSEHLADGQVAVLMTAGSEKSSYITGVAVAVSALGEHIEVSLNDIYAKAAERFCLPKEHITPASC
jgi:hypothetical protein